MTTKEAEWDRAHRRSHAAEDPPNAGGPTDDFKAPIVGGSDPVVRQDCSSAGSVSRHSEPAPSAPSAGGVVGGWQREKDALITALLKIVAAGTWIGSDERGYTSREANLARDALETLAAAPPAPIKSEAQIRREVREILFPEPVQRDDRSFKDSSADENLEAAIIDIEGGRADSVVVKTLNGILDRLVRARRALASESQSGEK